MNHIVLAEVLLTAMAMLEYLRPGKTKAERYEERLLLLVFLL